jgi:hypothetical protein
MANPTNFPGDIVVPGVARITGGITPTLVRSSILALVELAEYTIPWTAWRVHDALATVLPGTAANDDLGLIGGAFGSASPTIQSVDFGGTSTTAYARCQIPLPAEYEAGQTVTLRFHAGMLVVADATCTLDVVCYEADGEAGISADIVSESSPAQSINSATFADINFIITPSALTAGDLLDVRIVVAGTDATNAQANITAVIGSAKLLCDVR